MFGAVVFEGVIERFVGATSDAPTAEAVQLMSIGRVGGVRVLVLVWGGGGRGGGAATGGGHRRWRGAGGVSARAGLSERRVALIGASRVLPWLGRVVCTTGGSQNEEMVRVSVVVGE